MITKNSMAIQPFSQSHKKKILVLVSRGGGGHKTAGEAIQEILESSYDVEINPVLEDILKPMDTLNILTRGRFTAEDLYNFFLKHHHQKLLRWMVKSGKHYMRSHRIERIFNRYLSQLRQKPDLIISPTPFINYGVACAAQRYDIPFLILPTDLDASTFLLGFPEKPTHLNFKLSLAYNDPLIRSSTLHKTHLRDDQIVISGFPVRPACEKKYTPQEVWHIKNSFRLLETHATATLIMGAVGGNLILKHLEAITDLRPFEHGFKLQLNVCTGHNLQIFHKIECFLLQKGSDRIHQNSFRLPSGLVVHLRGYISNLIELMAASDIIITKTGSCTVNEAIYLDKKIILDNTNKSSARHLSWEQFNIPFVEKYGLGVSFSHSQQLPMLISSLLKYPEKPKKILEKPVFKEHLQKIVSQMIWPSF